MPVGSENGVNNPRNDGIPMTLSASDRRKNLNEALVLLQNSVDDRRFDQQLFRPTEFGDILPTTLKTLTDKDWLEEVVRTIGGPQFYRFTARGYLEALEISGRSREPQFLSQLGHLCRALKRHVDGRNDDAFVHIQQIADQAAVSVPLVYNAIECNLIDHIFRRTGARWYGSTKGQLITIPVNFGQELI